MMGMIFALLGIFTIDGILTIALLSRVKDRVITLRAENRELRERVDALERLCERL